ncbi:MULTISPECIES: exo-beta-N-acetylmuramidase NamZ domain-containing protein [unclassified Arenibacter]|jgi:uncharacterized protein YbbC (DUF1343 family)|uniref:exo-beta-N-acetylmuramidase NamZ family protein n=1 Tax=unclassified Arenibacter TaxID=2615047 RepID=UPI000E349453|nr:MULTISPECIES: DUF1343 domain-containing protein [unclassified Arenibacter]MCM4164235.1 DUF1343 domain-containing protein [Arenibacter sp. A80]RFT56027.1 DUF1343 domain-containing protein [Arenibacter sp. P308M17]
MAVFSIFKNTVLLLVFTLSSCGNHGKSQNKALNKVVVRDTLDNDLPITIAANRIATYLPLLEGKRVGIVANQTSVLFKDTQPLSYTHIVDSLLAKHINIKQVFAPEHGFRGDADAGEKVSDGKDHKTGLPIISLYGKNRKPSKEQLRDLDVILFDIQDVGVRFYTYIATMQLVMEACAENNIPIIVLDRPNPNGHYVDGPSMETQHRGFLGMTNIPLVYGMTIGEYANMINKEGWLENKVVADLTVIPMENYNHSKDYILPIRPSPNLPNITSIYLYPSLGLFEGTNVNAGRGTEFQFQRYGASFLDSTQYDFKYTPAPNFGSKDPKQKDKICYGKDLSKTPKMNTVNLDYLLDAYKNTKDKSLFFNTSGFTKHAGTTELQKQIEAGLSQEEIRKTWQNDIAQFKEIRAKYLIYN